MRTTVRTKFSLLPIARVYQPDGRTPLSGSKYEAQLYAGPTGSDLMPAGTAQPFFEDSVNGLPNGVSSLKGVFVPTPVVVPNVIAGRRMYAQVRAWDSTFGATYEEAKANGGPVGESKIVTTIAGSEETGPSQLHGIRSFSLREGSNPNP
jgi:hypothetical protein